MFFVLSHAVPLHGCDDDAEKRQSSSDNNNKKKTLQKKKKIHRVKVRSVVPKEDYTRNEKQRNGALREKKEPQ